MALVCICLASLPLPIAAVRIPSSETSERFPCQRCACGCKTAHQCWTNCCCHTPAQRVAWAKQEGVPIPQYAQHLLRQADGQVAGSSCAQCIKRQTVMATRHEEPSSSSGQPEQGALAHGGQRLKLVLSICALKCQGQSGEFSLLPWTVLPKSVVMQLGYQPLPSEVVLWFGAARTVFLALDPPPPRLASPQTL